MAFIRVLYGAEDAFEDVIPHRPYLRHVTGMFGVGVLFTMLLISSGHYYVQGVGYATILDVLVGSLTNVRFLVLLFVLKLMATSATLGSGASGGIFSPSLFMGATLGAAYGTLLTRWFPMAGTNPAVYALAGMARMVTGTTGAALTAVVMMFEMTLDYAVILPMTLTVTVSHGLRRLMLAQNIYTLKLVRRGHVMPEALQANAHLVHHLSDIGMSKAAVCSASMLPATLHFDDERADGPSFIVAIDGSRVVGVISRDWALGHQTRIHAARRLDEILQRDFVVVRPDTTIFELMALMQRTAASIAVVAVSVGALQSVEVQGVVTKADLAEALAEGMELFED